MKKMMLILAMMCVGMSYAVAEEAVSEFVRDNIRYTLYSSEDADPITGEVYDRMKCALWAEPIIPDDATYPLDLTFESGMELKFRSIPCVVRGITLPDNCGVLRSVTIPEGVLEVGGCNNCENMEQLDFPTTLKKINGYSFNYLPKLQSLVFPKSVFGGIEFRDECFVGCGAVSMEVYCDLILCHCCFKRMANLESIVFHEGLYTGEDCLSGMTKLKTLRLPSELGFVGTACFSYMDNLEELYLSEREDLEIAFNAFLGLPNLKVIYCPSAVPPQILDEWYAPSYQEFSSYPHDSRPIDKSVCKLMVPTGCVEAYRNSTGWGCFANIEEYQFAGIEGVRNDDVSGDGIYYDLCGRQVRNPGRGIYIVNGKKVAVR